MPISSDTLSLASRLVERRKNLEEHTLIIFKHSLLYMLVATILYGSVVQQIPFLKDFLERPYTIPVLLFGLLIASLVHRKKEKYVKELQEILDKRECVLVGCGERNWIINTRTKSIAEIHKLVNSQEINELREKLQQVIQESSDLG